MAVKGVVVYEVARGQIVSNTCRALLVWLISVSNHFVLTVDTDGVNRYACFE